jgi:hypothetical protein
VRAATYARAATCASAANGSSAGVNAAASAANAAYAIRAANSACAGAANDRGRRGAWRCAARWHVQRLRSFGTLCRRLAIDSQLGFRPVVLHGHKLLPQRRVARRLYAVRVEPESITPPDIGEPARLVGVPGREYVIRGWIRGVGDHFCHFST